MIFNPIFGFEIWQHPWREMVDSALDLVWMQLVQYIYIFNYKKKHLLGLQYANTLHVDNHKLYLYRYIDIQLSKYHVLGVSQFHHSMTHVQQ